MSSQDFPTLVIASGLSFVGPGASRTSFGLVGAPMAIRDLSFSLFFVNFGALWDPQGRQKESQGAERRPKRCPKWTPREPKASSNVFLEILEIYDFHGFWVSRRVAWASENQRNWRPGAWRLQFTVSCSAQGPDSCSLWAPRGVAGAAGRSAAAGQDRWQTFRSLVAKHNCQILWRYISKHRYINKHIKHINKYVKYIKNYVKHTSTY